MTSMRTRMNQVLAGTLLSVTLPAARVPAQTAFTIVEVEAHAVVAADQPGCDFDPGPTCFETIELSAASMDDFPLDADGLAQSPSFGTLNGQARVDASITADGLAFDLHARGPGEECCGTYLYLSGRATATVRVNLAEESLVRLRVDRVADRYDPQGMGTANGQNTLTITDATTGEEIAGDPSSIQETVWPAGDYIIEMESYGWTSCDCVSTMSQSIRLEDRPIPPILVVADVDPYAYLQIVGQDTYQDEDVLETLVADDIEALPASLSHTFFDDPDFFVESWRGRSASGIATAPNRITLRSESLAESSGWAKNHRHWTSFTFFDVSFELERRASLTVEARLDQSETIDWGQATGSTFGRVRITDQATGDVVCDVTAEAIGLVEQEFEFVLEPGSYWVWCDTDAYGLSTSGSSTHRSVSEIDLLFDPGDPADINGDGRVDGADLGALVSAWGACASCPADLNGDDVVDGADLGLFISSWTP